MPPVAMIGDPAEPVEARGLRTGSADLVVGAIVRGLYEGRLAAGQKLLEGDFVRRYAVGRGSVREAFRRLEAQGLLKVHFHRGASIRVFSRVEARDLLEVTETLSGLAARWAAERIGAASEADALRQAVSDFAENVEAGDSFSLALIRYRFYEQLVALTGNRELARLFPHYDMTVLRTQFKTNTTLNHERRTLVCFRRVLDLVLARDPSRAERVLREHIRKFSLSINRLPDDCFEL